MINQALFGVVKNQLASGVSEQEVMEFLRRRGVEEEEIREIFETLSPGAPSLGDIPVPTVEAEPIRPVAEDMKQEPSVAKEVEQIDIPAPLPTTSEAHGVVREIPPLQPSAPFVASSALGQLEAAESRVPTAEPTVVQREALVVPSGVVLSPVGGRKRLIAVIIAIVVVVGLLIGGSLYAYDAYFASPEHVMDHMIDNLRGVRSAAFSGEMTITTSEVGSLASTTTSAANPFAGMFAIQGPVIATIKASGLFDALNAEHPKLLVTLDATMDKWPLGDFVLGAEYRNIDKTSYLNIDDVPDLGFFSLSFLKNKWFMIKDREAKSQLGITSAPDSVIPAITDEQRTKLSEAWQADRFFVVTKSFGGETLDGISMRHYALTFDPDAFKRWDAQTNEILGNPKTDTTALDEMLARSTIEDLQIWIGRWDGLPHKVSMRISMRSRNDPSKTTAVNIVLHGDNFNKPMDVTVPEGAKPVEEALQGIFGQMLGGEKTALTTPAARNEQRRTDVTAIAQAIKKNMADNGGSFVCAAGPLPAKATFLGAAGPGGIPGYQIESCLVPKYLQVMPKDPSKGSFATSAYSAFYDQKTKKITVRAPYAELGVKISTVK